MTILKALDRYVRAILSALAVMLFILLACILLLNVFLRVGNDLSIFLDRNGMQSLGSAVKSLLPLTSMHWFDEIVELTCSSMVFYGAAALWARRGHFSVGDWISSRLPWKRMAAFYQVVVTLVSVVFMAIFFWYSLRLTLTASELSTVFQIPKKVMYACMPISSCIMMCYSISQLVVDATKMLHGDKEIKGQAATSM